MTVSVVPTHNRILFFSHWDRGENPDATKVSGPLYYALQVVAYRLIHRTDRFRSQFRVNGVKRRKRKTCYAILQKLYITIESIRTIQAYDVALNYTNIFKWDESGFGELGLPSVLSRLRFFSFFFICIPSINFFSSMLMRTPISILKIAIGKWPEKLPQSSSIVYVVAASTGVVRVQSVGGCNTWDEWNFRTKFTKL